jgi:hypothetical protein
LLWEKLFESYRKTPESDSQHPSLLNQPFAAKICSIRGIRATATAVAMERPRGNSRSARNMMPNAVEGRTKTRIKTIDFHLHFALRQGKLEISEWLLPSVLSDTVRRIASASNVLYLLCLAGAIFEKVGTNNRVSLILISSWCV